MHDRLRHALLGRWAAFTCDHAVAVIVLAVVFAALSIWVTRTWLTFQSDRNALISADLDWNQRYIEYKRKFYGRDQVIIVVEAPQGPDGKPDGAAARRFVDALVAEIQGKPHVHEVWYRIEADPLLMRQLPLAEYRQRLGEMAQAEPLLSSHTPGELLGKLTAALRNGSEGDAANDEQPTADQAAAQIDTITRFVALFGSVLTGDAVDPLAEAERMGLDQQWDYLSSSDGALLFLDVAVREAPQELDPSRPAVDELRAALDAVRAKIPGVNAGLTGIPVMEVDETVESMSDSTYCTLVALAAIAVLLVVAFHGWQLPVLALAALMFGVAWSFGFLTLAVGHLQVLSIVFTVILLGLGIDFAIHLISKFELVRHDYPDTVDGFRGAMVETMQSAGPGIITGAVTTAVAFGTTLLTDFTGMAEMGLIAGVGVMLCLLAMFTVLPAVLRLFWHRRHQMAPRHSRLVDFHAHHYLTPLVRHPVITLAVAAVLVLAAAVVGRSVRYDNNLLNMLPVGLESTKWQDIVVQHSDQAVWYAVSTTDNLDIARRRTAELRGLDVVASVGGIGLLFPPDEPLKIAAAVETRRTLGTALTKTVLDAHDPQTAAAFRGQLSGLALMVNVATGRQDVRSVPPVLAAFTRLKAELDAALTVMDTGALAEHSKDRMQRLQRAFEAIRDRVRDRIRRATLDRSIQVDDLPPYLHRDSVSITEPAEYQLKVYPRQNVWDPRDLEPFIKAIRGVDAEATGSPFQIYESGELMKRSYTIAGLFAFMAVFLLVYLDFTRLYDAVLCLLPVAVGFVLMLGVMALAGVSINPANVIVLPLMFGIGVDAGVHIMHRYQQDRRANPPGLSHGTGKGIILTSATTIIGFSAMMLARHRGIQSLGFVLSVGIGATLMASLVLMPALLALRNRYHVWRRYKQWQRIGKEEEARRRAAT